MIKKAIVVMSAYNAAKTIHNVYNKIPHHLVSDIIVVDDFSVFINFHKIRYRGEKKQDWGISGFVLIAESHISVHTFPDREYINIDIFSCKNFDITKSEKQVKKIFNINQIKSVVIDRGIDFEDPEEMMREMTTSRTNLSTQVMSNKDKKSDYTND